jgi:hypothetical protein
LGDSAGLFFGKRDAGLAGRHGDIYAALKQVWQGYLPLGADDMKEKIGRLLKEIGYEAKISDFFS